MTTQKIHTHVSTLCPYTYYLSLSLSVCLSLSPTQDFTDRHISILRTMTLTLSLFLSSHQPLRFAIHNMHSLSLFLSKHRNSHMVATFTNLYRSLCLFQLIHSTSLLVTYVHRCLFVVLQLPLVGQPTSLFTILRSRLSAGAVRKRGLDECHIWSSKIASFNLCTHTHVSCQEWGKNNPLLPAYTRTRPGEAPSIYPSIQKLIKIFATKYFRAFPRPDLRALRLFNANKFYSII